MSIVIFLHLGFCCLASFSRNKDFVLHAFELVVVGIGGFELGCLLWLHLFGRHCRMGDHFQILLSLIAAFCITVSKWMSNGGITVTISSA
jgi:hypothetical protein